MSKILSLVGGMLLAGCGGGGSGDAPPSSGGGGTLPDATLSWTIPASRAIGGGAMTADDIRGYRVYVGTSLTELTLLAEITGGNKDSYEVRGLPPGTYYFAISAVSSDGMESALSSIKSKTI